jgi:hypothetical protein
MLKHLGYAESPARASYGFGPWDRDYLAKLVQRDRASQHSILTAARPPVIGFWYRQHRTEFRVDSFLPGPEIGNDVVTYDSPPNTEPGMIRAFLDQKGRLLQLEVRPIQSLVAAGFLTEAPVPEWRRLFVEADLDPQRFKPAAPISVAPVAVDSQMAWTGTFAEDPASPVRVEAAWRHGKPVFFDIRGFWTHESPFYALTYNVPPGTPSIFPPIVFFTFVSMLVGPLLAARYNLRLGRGDRKGASQLAGLTFICSMCFWACSAWHVAGYWELHLVIKALSTAAFASAVVWSLYLAIEPAVRRHWPDSLISWTRLQRHRVRDPLVASHVLAGTLVISVFIALRFARLQLSPAKMPMAFTFTSLDSTAMFVANLAGSVVTGLIFGMFFLLLVVIIRLRIRRVLLADLVASTLLAFGTMGPANLRSGTLVMAASGLGIAMNFSLLWVLRRFGFLALLLSWILWQISVAAPISWTSWYAGRSVTLLAIPAGMAAWALWVIATGERRPRTLAGM